MKERNAALVFAGAAAVAASFSQSAKAADFVGPRAEVTVGADRVEFDLATVGSASRGKAHGVSIGGAIGYDVDVGGLIVGIEGGISTSTADRSYASADGVTSLTLNAGRDIDLSGRLGTRIGDRTLFYGKAGYTNLRIGTELSSNGVVSSKTNLDGYRLGLGLEQGMGQNTYAKAEYRYSNYEHDVAKNEVLAGFGIRF